MTFPFGIFPKIYPFWYPYLSLFLSYLNDICSVVTYVVQGSNYQQCVEKSQFKDDEHFGHTR